MMRVWHVAAGLAATVLLAPAVGSAQGLGQAAAKEKEKRKGKTAKVYTEDDLRRAGAPGTLSMGGDSSDAAAPADGTAPPADGQAAAPGADGAAATAPGGPKQKSEEEQKTEAQDAWRKKLEKARSDVSVLREQVNKIQTDLNDTSLSFYGSRRTTMVSLLEQNKQKLAAKEQEITQLEDDGRRLGYR
jgi:hypothetical protein